MDIINKLKIFSTTNKAIILIALLVFLLSIFYSFHFKITPVVDAKAYDVIAQNLVAGAGYRENLNVDIQHDYAIARVGPLYEFFLAGIYKIFGHNYEAVWIIQAILRAVSAILVYLTALIIFEFDKNKKNIAILSALIFGFLPDLVEISAMLMTETLYLFLLCLMLYLFFRYFKSVKYWESLVLGGVSGLAILARPPVLFFVPIILYHFFVNSKRKVAILFICATLLTFVPWSVRNYVVYDRFMPLGAAGSFNFWIGNYHGGKGEQEPRQEQYTFVANHEMREINAESMTRFKEFLLSHPVEFVKITFLRINKYFSFARPMGFWFYQSGWGQLLFVISSTVSSIFLFILGIWGLVKAFKQKEKMVRYLSIFTFITPLIIFITVVETRYRFQIYPFLALFSGYVLMYSKEKFSWWKDKILFLVIVVFFSNTILDLMIDQAHFRDKLGPFIKYLL